MLRDQLLVSPAVTQRCLEQVRVEEIAVTNQGAEYLVTGPFSANYSLRGSHKCPLICKILCPRVSTFLSHIFPICKMGSYSKCIRMMDVWLLIFPRELIKNP